MKPINKNYISVLFSEDKSFLLFDITNVLSTSVIQIWFDEKRPNRKLEKYLLKNLFLK